MRKFLMLSVMLLLLPVAFNRCGKQELFCGCGAQFNDHPKVCDCAQPGPTPGNLAGGK